MIKQSQKGFTIIELLIATTVFSVILLVLASGLIEIGRIYYKGVVISRTQEAARVIAEDVARSIQFSGGQFQQVGPSVLPPGTASPSGPNVYCVGGRRYSFILNQQVKDSPVKHAVLVDNPSGDCVAAPLQNFSSPLAGSEELLGVNVRLSNLVITQVGTSNLYSVKVQVTYGDDDLLDDKLGSDGMPGSDNVLDTCKSIRSGSQFCATSILNTIVEKRIQ